MEELDLDELKKYRRLAAKYPNNVSSKIINRLLDKLQQARELNDEIRTQLADRRGPISDNSRFPFGKHKGKPMDRVPLDYLRWWFDQQNPDALEMDANFKRFPEKAVAIQKLKLYDYIERVLKEYDDKDKDDRLQQQTPTGED